MVDENIMTAWRIEGEKVIWQGFFVEWNNGHLLRQERENIYNLHRWIDTNYGQKALEVSTKSETKLGVQLSSYSLKKDGVFIENEFQAAKKYENGGPFLDLLRIKSKEAKRDARHRTSGTLIAYCKNGEEWPIKPSNAFYDYLYISSIIKNYGVDIDLTEYDWFTDIDYNPRDSIRCQARPIAVYKLLQRMCAFDVINDKDRWLEFFEQHVWNN